MMKMRNADGEESFLFWKVKRFNGTVAGSSWEKKKKRDAVCACVSACVCVILQVRRVGYLED